MPLCEEFLKRKLKKEAEDMLLMLAEKVSVS